MRKRNRILIMLAVTLLMVCMFSVPAFALTESEVQAQVDAQGKEAVTGNVFIWFLCAIAFLKVSQKIDSFMSSLGINVGHTGGSMLVEAMIAARGIATARNFTGGGHGGHSSGGSSSGTSGGTAFMSGGLAGVVSHSFTNSAVKKATGSGGGGLGGKAYDSSVIKGGGFANSVIGKVATGNISSTGSMTGKHILRLLVNIGKITVQLSADHQRGIDGSVVFFQIPSVPLSPYSDGLMLCFGQLQIGDKITSNLLQYNLVGTLGSQPRVSSVCV